MWICFQTPDIFLTISLWSEKSCAAVKHNIIFCFQTSCSSVALKLPSPLPHFPRGHSSESHSFPVDCLCTGLRIWTGKTCPIWQRKNRRSLFILKGFGLYSRHRKKTKSEDWHERGEKETKKRERYFRTGKSVKWKHLLWKRNRIY